MRLILPSETILQRAMLAPRVVPADVDHERELEVESHLPRVAFGEFPLERRHDALGHGVVQSRAGPAFARSDAGPQQELRVFIGCVLASVVGVRNQSVRMFLPGCERHVESVGDEALAHVTCKLPAHDAPRVHIEHDGEMGPALPRADVGEVR